MTRTTASCLFGGALFAAGVAHAAPQFDFIDNPAENELYAYAYDSANGYAYGYASSGTVSYTFADVSASAMLASAGASVATSITGGGPFNSADTFVRADFTVSGETVGRAAWDFAELGGVVSPQLRVRDLTNDATLFTLTAGDGMSGVFDVTLQAGVLYTLELVSFQQGNGGFASLSFTAIPSPGAAGGLGLAGLWAVRRRR